MLRWTIILFVLAIIAAVLGFGGLSDTFADVGKIVFFIFLVLAVISAISGAFRR